MMIAILISALDTKKENLPNAPSIESINEINILYDKAIQKGYSENPESDIGKRRKRSKELNLLNRLNIHKVNIMKFLSNPEIPFDNNESERALRMEKTKNKISCCFRSNDDIQYFCKARSFIDTCRKQKLNILDSIVAILSGKTFKFATE